MLHELTLGRKSATVSMNGQIRPTASPIIPIIVTIVFHHKFIERSTSYTYVRIRAFISRIRPSTAVRAHRNAFAARFAPHRSPPNRPFPVYSAAISVRLFSTPNTTVTSEITSTTFHFSPFRCQWVTRSVPAGPTSLSTNSSRVSKSDPYAKPSIRFSQIPSPFPFTHFSSQIQPPSQNSIPSRFVFAHRNRP